MAGHSHDHHDDHALEHHDLGDGKAAYRRIFIILILLGVLTIVELPAAETGSAILLFIIAFGKAALVVYFFMHVYRLWREDAH